MHPVYIVEQGAKLGVESRLLVVEKDGQALQKIPMVKIEAVVLFGNVAVTTPALKRLMSEGKDIVFLTLDGEYCGRVVGPQSTYGQLRHLQYGRFGDKAFAAGLARLFVRGKLLNMRTLLLRYSRKEHEEAFRAVAENLGTMAKAASEAPTVQALMGLEGAGTAQYFSVFKHLFHGDWHFEKRVRRPPTDPVNVLLSFGYTLLLREMEAAVNLVGLDPYLGFLHGLAYGRPSLALDLMEEFRPIVVDSVVLRACNTGQVTPAHFHKGDSAERPVVLDDAGRRAFLQAWETRLSEKFRHPDSQESVTYRRVFELQVRSLARHIKGEGTYRPFLVR